MTRKEAIQLLRHTRATHRACNDPVRNKYVWGAFAAKSILTSCIGVRLCKPYFLSFPYQAFHISWRELCFDLYRAIRHTEDTYTRVRPIGYQNIIFRVLQRTDWRSAEWPVWSMQESPILAYSVMQLYHATGRISVEYIHPYDLWDQYLANLISYLHEGKMTKG